MFPAESPGLSPVSFPLTGKVKWYKQISGDYFQVDPVALHSSVNILTENARCAVCIESKEFGEVLFVAVGATDVGTVEYVLFFAWCASVYANICVASMIRQ